MRKSFFIFLTSLTLVSQAFMQNTHAWDSFSPTFLEDGDVVFASRGGLCGRLKLDKLEDVTVNYNGKAADLVIKSFRTNFKGDNYNFENRFLGSATYRGVPQVFSYDWAGPIKQVYRLQCFVRTNIDSKNYEVKKDCSKIIKVESLYHDQVCRAWHRANDLNTSIFKKVKALPVLQ